ncbi:hypothetical protein VKT23_007821 [Stygiomarasmius scandens]|uniref:G domain-containing protein n=1 Tax=Marasmiellus scandens TaxID=2682957 RepID=A0ABR1JNX0_9AGAR
MASGEYAQQTNLESSKHINWQADDHTENEVGFVLHSNPPQPQVDNNCRHGTPEALTQSSPNATEDCENNPVTDIDFEANGDTHHTSHTGILESSNTNSKTCSSSVEGQRNIILFGAAGSGKSSIVNLLANSVTPLATPSNAVKRIPFDSTRYPITFPGGQSFNIWDTTGLIEGNSYSDSRPQTRRSLENLLKDLHAQGGVHLLVLCIFASRITDIVARNYKMFTKDICQGKANVVVVVTGLENEEPPLENWWSKNEQAFKDYGMNFTGHACITSIKGKHNEEEGYKYQEEYDKSRKLVENLIETKASETGFNAGDVENVATKILAGTFGHIWQRFV